MTQKSKGTITVAAAACCYGLLGTFVKLAYKNGYAISEITVSQFALGFIVLLLAWRLSARRRVTKEVKNSSKLKSNVRMVVAGTSLGLTSTCYYMAVRSIPVSLAIVLLMQSVWLSAVVQSILDKRTPGISRIISMLVIVAGTLLATGALHVSQPTAAAGMLWGLLAALSYTATIYSSNHIDLQLPPLKRSMLMISGGLIIVLLVFLPGIMDRFSIRILFSWGLLISLFGTILPPILLTRGMPLISMSMGAMLTSIEVPVAIVSAHYLLGESISLLQWSGVILILAAIIFINWPVPLNKSADRQE